MMLILIVVRGRGNRDVRTYKHVREDDPSRPNPNYFGTSVDKSTRRMCVPPGSGR